MKDCGVLGDNMCILGKEVNIGAKLVIVIIKMHVARSRSNANPIFFTVHKCTVGMPFPVASAVSSLVWVRGTSSQNCLITVVVGTT
jgi:hypothetical protein